MHGCWQNNRIRQHKPKILSPLEHSEYLTRSSGLNNLAAFFQYISLLGNVEDKVVECFKNGGGIPNSEYPRFGQLQAEESSRVFDSRLLTDIIPPCKAIN